MVRSVLKVGLLAETLLEAAAQDNPDTGSDVASLREETRKAKRMMAQARRERALKAMGMGSKVEREGAAKADAANEGVRFRVFSRVSNGHCARQV